MFIYTFAGRVSTFRTSLQVYSEIAIPPFILLLTFISCFIIDSCPLKKAKFHPRLLPMIITPYGVKNNIYPVCMSTFSHAMPYQSLIMLNNKVMASSEDCFYYIATAAYFKVATKFICFYMILVEQFTSL